MVLLVALPLFYILSIGPAIYAVEKFHLTFSMRRPVSTFYYPVRWLHDHTPLKQALESYVEWWMRLAGIPPPVMPSR